MVIKIAVIISSKERQEAVASFLKRNLPIGEHQWVMVGYSGVESLLRAMHGQRFRPDVVLLPAGPDGYSLGRRVRSMDHRCVLIYMPDVNIDFHDAFSSCPIAHFTLWKNEDCKKALTRAVQYLEDETWLENECVQRDAVFQHQSQKQLIRIKYDNIDFFESDLHRVIIHRQNGETEAFIGKLKDVERNCSEHFARVHQSYLVNVKHIARIYKNSRRILFYSGNEAFCSRASFQNFLGQYAELEVVNGD